jgi:hypothetical protein
MPSDDQKKWLDQHIPHRLHAALADLPLQREIIQALGESHRQEIEERCKVSATTQGRLAAIRWLIEFIGVQDRRGKPDRPRQSSTNSTDISISQIQGGKAFDLSLPEAEKLRQVWKGCAQAVGHPTDRTNHPPVNDKELDEALRIIRAHLESTIYATSKQRLVHSLIT